jgi:hypothetical protein
MTAPTFLSLTALAAAALLAAAPAFATENSQVRGLLGAPSYELATPQFPGWYGQIWYQHYEANKLRDSDGRTPTQTAATPFGPVTLGVNAKVRADVIVPRVTYITEKIVFDGRLGFSATLPVTKQSTTVRFDAALPAGLSAGQIAAVNSLLAQQGAAHSGSHTGLADSELAAFIDWQQDESRIVGGLAVVAPVGDYDKDRVVNTGSGRYWTLRPLLVASRVWENGLEVGLRATYSFNTVNHATDVRSGQYLHADWAAMYRASDRWHVGLQGYVVKQTTGDTGPGVAADGNKVQALSAGPVVAYIPDSGNWGLDFKLMQEFSVRNRPEGMIGWLRLNVRLD